MVFEIFKISNDDVTFLRNAETAILEKKQKKNTTTIVAIERTTIVIVKTGKKGITTDDRVLSETAPSCNNCVATIHANGEGCWDSVSSLPERK